jgi:dipeptidyl aminopeptidase/acylaminoacyl peptidase
VRYRESTGERTTVATGPAAAWQSIDLPEPELVEASIGPVTLQARRYAAGHGRMLCWVHGGPTDQWQVEFRPRLAYWWSRGWDVLVVDPRGSSGHGRTYQQSLRGQWGRLDVDDAAALVAHAHRLGWATPASTVAMGASSGGLTALGLLADHPQLLAGAVVAYPVSDLAALAAATHRFEAHYTDTLVGPRSDTEHFALLSPISRADRITSPLLVFHGTDDPVVPIGQSEALVNRVNDHGGDAELVVYEGEGHGFREAEHQRDEYLRTERFLVTHVGG